VSQESATEPPTADLRALVAARHVIVCCGTGGVGKTTTAAALALAAARSGRNAVVVTIDPAKRLADALGLEGLTNTPAEIDPSRWNVDGTARPRGRLHALMLDTKSTFDQLVLDHANDDVQAARILANPFYRNISGVLSGTQEYMAMEKIHELHEHGGFDVIVVDTPPARHALDFLDAPNRLSRLLDNRIFRLLTAPTRTTLHVTGLAVQAFLRTVSRVVGSEAVDGVVAFFRAFEGMEQGFRERARAVSALLASPSTAFVLVTAPRRDAVGETEYFASRLADKAQAVDALVVNRVQPMPGTAAPGPLRARARDLAAAPAGAGPARQRLATRYLALADLADAAERERTEVAPLVERLGAGVVVVHVPELDVDVYDFAALRAIGSHLVGDEHPTAKARPTPG
jgi:anion-transporting  ArsA/GET3 family ATPase